jgi:acyl-CoA thioesterase-1
LVLAVVLLLLSAFGAANAGSKTDRPLRLLAFGDSLIHGYGLPAGQTFPEQLEAVLEARGFAVEVINAGNSGDTTASGRSRIDWALAGKPDLVLVAIGGNDGLRGIDPAATFENLDAILARLAASGLPVLLAGMLAPRNLGADYVADFDAIFPRLAEKHGIAFYPFFLDGVVMDPALNQADGIHPNAAGVRVIAERIAPRLGAMIEALRDRARDGPGEAGDG